MAYRAIVNAAPDVRLLGTQDSSTRELIREPRQTPVFCPKIYIYAQKGPTTPQLVVGGSRALMYGTDSFDLRSKWANHATLYANAANQEGTSCMLQRVLPKDAGPEANLMLSLEVLEDDIDNYERNSDGSYEIDTNTNLPKVKNQIPGFKTRWLVTYADNLTDLQNKYGKRTIEPGTLQTGGGVKSKIYPILDLKASYRGSAGNDIGIRIWAPTTTTTGGFDRRLLTQSKVYPFRIAVINRNPKTATAKIKDTLFGDQSVLTTFKQNVIDPFTDAQLSFEDIFLDSYRNTTDRRYAPIFGDWGDAHVYRDNIEDLLKEFYKKEKEYFDANPTITGYDFSTTAGVDESDKWLFNFFTGQSSTGYPYHTFVIDRTSGGRTFGEFSNFYAAGSSDGTMNDANFEQLVIEAMDEYLDENSQVMNTALNVETVFVDSGFGINGKKALCNALAHRKNTFVMLATLSNDGRVLTASEDNSLAVALRTRLQLFPESDYFGTHVMRGLVMGRDGKLRSSQWKRRVSPLYEVFIKACRYMGAGDGKFRANKHFDGAPGSILDYIYDVSVPFTPISVRNRDWDAGLNWVQSYDLESNFIPALKTVYNDDTSVLNSFITAIAICELNNIAERAWRYYSGTSKLSTGQLAERIDNFIRTAVEGKFDYRFKIEPKTYYTDADKRRGYSGTTRIRIYANNMWTVMESYIQAFRMEDFGNVGD